MTIVLTLLGSVVSAILYRLGGASREAMDKEYPWIPAWFKDLPKKRDVGCTLVALGIMALKVSAPWWAWLLSFGLCWAALTTYHDTKPWNWMKPDDNFYLHGFGVGLAFLPFAAAPGLFVPLMLRALIMGAFMGIWCHLLFDTDYIEEWGRGAIIILSLFIL